MKTSPVSRLPSPVSRLPFLLFALALVLASCSLEAVEEASALDPAVEGYFSTLSSALEQESAASRAGKQAPGLDILASFQNATVVDSKGLESRLGDLPIEEQFALARSMIALDAKRLNKEAAGNPSLLAMMSVRSLAFERATKAQKTSSLSFAELYAQEVMRANTELAASFQRPTTVVAAGAKSISSRAVLQGAYKTGRVIVAQNGSSNGSITSTLGIGHTTLMSEAAWNPEWNAAPYYAFTTTSAWGDTNAAYVMRNGFQGVEKERLAYWVGEISQVPNPVVQVLEVGNMNYQYDRRIVGYDQRDRPIYETYLVRSWFSPSTAAEGVAAANYAIAQIGKPFNWFPYDQYRTDSFYCSSLVWRSWNIVDPKYDLDTSTSLWWVAPFDISASVDRTVVATIYN